jgi:alpha-D-xyloside xylohydrolase
MIRALAMDFAADKNVWNRGDEYMFGSSLLVCPVFEPMYSRVVSGEGRNVVREADFSTTGSKEVYLPKGADWYDFWDNGRFAGGQTIRRETPIDIMPLYVRAGSIIPFGPRVQYAQEKPWDSLEIRVWAGADGSFTLYEDEGDNYNYEKGAFSEITFSWDDSQRTLTVGDRSGSFPGMLQQRTLRVTLIEAGKANPALSVSYNGEKVVVEL